MNTLSVLPKIINGEHIPLKLSRAWTPGSAAQNRGFLLIVKVNFNHKADYSDRSEVKLRGKIRTLIP